MLTGETFYVVLRQWIMYSKKFNMITSIIGGVLLCIGILLLVIKGMSVEYIDANGILHENFFLVPIGFMCIFCGLISFVSIGIRTIVIKIKDRND